MLNKNKLSCYFSGIENRERIDLFISWNIQMTPADFIYKWGISYSELAELLDVDYPLIYSWMSPNKKTNVSRYYLTKIAIADFFFEFYEYLPLTKLKDYLD